MLPSLKKSYRYDPVKDFTPVALVRVLDGVRGQPQCAGRDAARAHRLRQGQSRQAALRQRRRRRGAAHRGRDAQAQDGSDLVHVPYRGGAQAATDAISGQIELVSMGSPARASPRAASCACWRRPARRRHPMFADVPTTAELGLPDVRMETWFGLIAPPGTPDAVVARRGSGRRRGRGGGGEGGARRSNAGGGSGIGEGAASRWDGRGRSEFHLRCLAPRRQEVAGGSSRRWAPGDE